MCAKLFVSLCLSMFSFIVAGCASTQPYVYVPIETDKLDPVGKYCYENEFLKKYDNFVDLLKDPACQGLSQKILIGNMETLFMMYGERDNFKTHLYLKGKYYACLDRPSKIKDSCDQYNNRASRDLEQEVRKENDDINMQAVMSMNHECEGSSFTRMMLMAGQVCSLSHKNLDKEFFEKGYVDYLKEKKLKLVEDKLDSAYRRFSAEL